MSWEKLLMAACAAVMLYIWAGYPALLYLLSRPLRPPRVSRSFRPTFSIVIAVHNEEAQISAKLEDCRALRYPEHAVEIIVASDGSTDATEAIVSAWTARDGRIRFLPTQGRAGKSGAQNLAVAEAHGEILLFTDAETRTQCDLLERIADNFSNAKVGLVAPALQLGRIHGAVGQGQGAYWRFELRLRQMESDLGILATASGSAFALRRELFRPIPLQFGDDCVVPLDVRRQGFRIVQDPQARVSDEMPQSVEGELRSRIRMTARNWSGILSRPQLLNPIRFPGTAWGLVSHKFLRWMTPFFLAIALLLNGWMAIHSQWRLLLLIQVGFYVAALIGWRRSRRPRGNRWLGYPFAFCLANLGFFLGIVRCLRGQQVVTYK